MQWLKYTWASGFALLSVVILAGCVAFSLVTLGRISWLPLGLVAAILVGVSVQRYMLVGRGSAAVSERESIRRATLTSISKRQVEVERPIVGVVLNESGRVESYVAIIAGKTDSETTILRVTPRWPRGTVSEQEHVRFDDARASAGSWGATFIPQSKYSDALWAHAFRPGHARSGT